jgi:hypothetical protein
VSAAQKAEVKAEGRQQKGQEEQAIGIESFAKLKTKSVRQIGAGLSREQFEYGENRFYKDYLRNSQKGELLEKYVQGENIYRYYSNKRKEILYSTGARKEILGEYEVVHFDNGDIRQKLPGGIDVYYYAANQTTEFLLPDNLKVYKFGNGQIEFHFGDGRQEVIDSHGNMRFLPEQEEDY